MKELAKIICGFPGVGKSTLTKNQKSLGLKIMDSDSSKFSWISPGVRNPEFPANYINHISSNLHNADIILVSTHKEVLDSLFKEGFQPYLVYPLIELKDEYLERFRVRGSDEKFIKLLNENWDVFIRGLMSDGRFINHIILGPGEYLSDIINKIRIGI